MTARMGVATFTRAGRAQQSQNSLFFCQNQGASNPTSRVAGLQPQHALSPVQLGAF